MSITHVLAVVTVADMEPAREWYERLLGRRADRIPMDGCAEWEITGGGGLQLVQDAGRAGHALVTLGVDDLQKHIAELARRDISVGAIFTNKTRTGEQMRIASATDPEGNTITFGEEPATRPVRPHR